MQNMIRNRRRPRATWFPRDGCSPFKPAGRVRVFGAIAGSVTHKSSEFSVGLSVEVMRYLRFDFGRLGESGHLTVTRPRQDQSNTEGGNWRSGDRRGQLWTYGDSR